ncbi:MAG: efflux RND transporter permease subunit [Elusimicrobia bacterium]|nr:efflux RND transporter permease subunit [Elusimicrobiota bacterium]
MRSLIKYFIDRNLLVGLLTFIVLSWGMVNMVFMHREGYPQVDYGILNITTTYPGASPEDVELNVTIPIEEAIKGLEGIDEYYSASYENISEITVNIDLTVSDIEKVKSDIRRAVDGVDDLPQDVKDRPSIFEQKISNFSVLQIGVFSDTLTESELRTRVLDLEKKLKSLPLVSRIRRRGVRDREVHIKLDLEKLNSYHISLDEVMESIRAHNVQVSGGTIESYISEKTIVTISKFKNLTDVKDVIVRSNFEGKRIYLKDVARIEDTFDEEFARVRFNGRDGMALYVIKKENTDVIKAVDSIKRAVAEFEDTLKGTDIGFAYLWDMSEETRTRLDIAQRNAVIGLVLVVAVLFLFLNTRNALWTAVGLPFSFCFAAIFSPLFGVTINSIALLGIIVVLGMVVDDAIIISENIFRHRLMGDDPKQAGVTATMEVAFPVITTILTTIVAFVPIYFIEGEIGRFSKDIPTVVILVLTGSLLESLFLLPNHVTAGRVRPGGELREKKFIIWMKDRYNKLLVHILRLRYLIIIAFIAVAASTYFFVFKNMKFDMFPDVDANTFWLYGKTTEVKSLEYTSDMVKQIEDTITSAYDDRTIKSYETSIGGGGRPEKFSMQFFLLPSQKRDATSDDVINTIRNKIDDMGVFENVHIEKDTGGPPTGRGLSIHIIGNDDIRRKKTADTIVKYLESTSGVYDLERSDKEVKTEVHIIPRQEEIARLGITSQDIANAVRVAYDGYIVTDLQLSDELVEYRVMLDDDYRRKLDTLKKLKVLNNQGKLVVISNLVDIREGKTETEVRRYEGDKVTSISADVKKDVITPAEIYAKIKEDFSNFEADNPGFRLKMGGEAEETAQSIGSLMRALGVAVAGIAFILLLFFKSVTKPVMVMLAIPFGLIGVVLAFYTHGIPLSTMALLGVVGLSGVVVNDSLVMVEFINLLRTRHPDKPLVDLVREGAVLRLRPIVLTTITTAASVMPTSYGIGGVDIMIKPATFALFWGLIFGTTLTLILMPCLYVIESDIFGRFRKNGVPAALRPGA